MIGLLQRVTEARVEARGATVAEIGLGLLVLVAIERGDTEVQAERLLERLLGYRVFPDVEGKMNRSLRDIGGGLLLVPQSTLAADTRKGMRPSLTPATDPSASERLFAYLGERARAPHPIVALGRFGARMQVGWAGHIPAAGRAGRRVGRSIDRATKSRSFRRHHRAGKDVRQPRHGEGSGWTGLGWRPIFPRIQAVSTATCILIRTSCRLRTGSRIEPTQVKGRGYGTRQSVSSGGTED